MKLTDSEVIKAGERELIDTIIGDLDWSAIEKIFKDRHQLQICDDVEYRRGDLVVKDGQVAYHLEFDVKVKLSILLDRSGNYLSLAVQRAEESGLKQEEESIIDSDLDCEQTDGSAADPCKPAMENMAHMADQIAEMLSEINED